MLLGKSARSAKLKNVCRLERIAAVTLMSPTMI
jgi:hypothetical protein